MTGRMVCFLVHILIPLQQRDCNNTALDSHVEHLVRHLNATIHKTVRYETETFYEIAVCDEDTVALLRDFPTPFSVLKIDFLQNKQNLFTYRKHHSPPRIPLLKNIYWLAKSTERWKLPTSHVQYQTI